MNAKTSFVIVSLAVGALIAGCNSDTAKEDAAQKKAFLGGPMPKGFMDKNGPAAGKAAGMQAAQEAAAKAAAANAGK